MITIALTMTMIPNPVAAGRVFQSEYRALSETCKSYAVDLLDLCRSNEEVIAALHGGSNIRDLSRIRMAIRYEQKKVRDARMCGILFTNERVSGTLRAPLSGTFLQKKAVVNQCLEFGLAVE